MVADAAGLSLVAAFGAGIISFVSPCVAPVVPGYLSLISGVTVDGSTKDVTASKRLLVASLVFVAGFTLVFVALGVTAGGVGGLLQQHRILMNRVAGGFMILAGLFIMGLFQLPWLYRERRFHPTYTRSLTRSETLLLGMAFGFGWTPCIGPLLVTILVYASASNTAARGTLLLLSYSLGLGLPFIVIGVGVGRLLGAVRWITRHYQIISILSGATLIATGFLFMTNRLFYLNVMSQRMFDQVVHPLLFFRL
ncbi:MAG TPA: cytochrome c biogenesis protein CcdA [Nitrolancea sp.]|nr:cytochrome c biogenesis protein CcdA [Nitrolancea sp.]